MSREIVLQRWLDCESDVCSVWKGLSDTDWINRALGNERLEVSGTSDASAARYEVKTHLAGIPLVWTERPYEFDFMKSLKVRRDVQAGPIERLEVAYSTEAKGLNSRVGVELRLTARSIVLLPLIRIIAAVYLRNLVRVIQRMDRSLVGGGALPELPSVHGVNEERLRRAAKQLIEACPGEASQRLADLIEKAPDDRVVRIRPYELAEAWALPRRQVLVACLHAVKAGLLQLRWELVCPSCRTGASTVDSLSELGSHGSCQLCEIGFGLDLDESVEATFRPAPALRRVETGPFCIGSPARSPHVVSQAIFGKDHSAILRLPDEEGTFRLFLRGGRSTLVTAEKGGASAFEIADDEKTQWPERIRVAPTAAISVRTTAQGERHAKLEKRQFASLAATARDVALLPVFRRDFSAQVLRPGLSLQIQRIALVFSDLTGSTDLYADAGDAEAFRFVQAHFEVLSQAVERCGGTVVKTMGDAVMAAFPDEQAALAAACDMMRDFEALRERDPQGRKTSLKVGLYGGPGFVAMANRVLDYFGQTVNVAARLQGEAKPGEVVAPVAVVDEAVARGVVPRESVIDRYAATLKGVTVAVPVARVRLISVGSSQARS